MVFLAALMIAGVAQGIPINGDISFVGKLELDDTLANATEILGFSAPVSGMPNNPNDDPVVQYGSQTGAYSAVPAGTPAAWQPFVFSPPDASVLPLWTFTIGGITYSFDALSVMVDQQDSTALHLSGSGIARITGYEDTAGTWSITSTEQNGATFTFGGSTSAISNVPDGGATFVLLAFGVIGVLAFAQRLNVAVAKA